MPNSSFADYVLNDLFEGISGISGRNMFGAFAFFKDGKMFGMVVDGKLYFKAGVDNNEDFINAGSKQFAYKSNKGKMIAMSYWEVPEDILENKVEIEIWVQKAICESQRSKK